MAKPPVVLATASYDRTIRFWEAPSGVCIRTLNFQDSQVNCMCTSPDKNYLAAAGHKQIRLWNIRAYTQTTPVSTVPDAHSGNVTALTYHQDGTLLFSASEDGFIKIWDSTMACKKKLEVKAPVNTLVLHPDQYTIISGDQTGRLCVWDTKYSDECIQELVPGGDVGIRSVTVGPHSETAGGMCCAANNTGDVFVMHLVEQVESTRGSTPHPSRCFRLKLEKTFKAHNKYILKCLLSHDSSLLATCSADTSIKLWRTQVGKDHEPWTLYKTLQGHSRWVWDCAFSGDGEYLVSASSDNTAKLWAISKGVERVNYHGHHKPVTCVVVDDRPQTDSHSERKSAHQPTSASPAGSGGQHHRP